MQLRFRYKRTFLKFYLSIFSSFIKKKFFLNLIQFLEKLLKFNIIQKIYIFFLFLVMIGKLERTCSLELTFSVFKNIKNLKKIYLKHKLTKNIFYSIIFKNKENFPFVVHFQTD